MRKAVVLLAGVVLASSAKATPVVTYTVSVNESLPGQFAIYASVSQGDNSGLFAYSVDLRDPASIGEPDSITIFYQRTPAGTFDANPADPNYLPGPGRYPTKYIGFGAVRAQSASAGTVSGMQDLSRGKDLIRLFGAGQVAHNINDFRPPPATSTGVPVAYGDYLRLPNSDPLAGTDNPYGNPENLADGMQLPAGSIRIASGRFWASTPTFDLAGSNSACVWKLNTSSDEVEAADIVLQVREFYRGTALFGPVTLTSTTNVCSVPEPGVMAVVALGAVLGARRRRSLGAWSE